MAPSIPSSWIWKVTYTSSHDLDRGRVRVYDGTLHLWIKESRCDWVVLKDDKDHALTGRDVLFNEKIDLGSQVCFSSYSALVGICVSSPQDLAVSSSSGDNKVVSDLDLKGSKVNSKDISKVTCISSALDKPVVEKPMQVPEEGCSSAVYDAITMGLDFSRGYDFAKEVKRIFLSTVHPTMNSDQFIMVVSFARANFRLDVDTVAIALESAIGGLCGSLHVSLLHDRTFSFVVSSKLVGFHIYKLKSFVCKQFKCFFHLWGRGGPHWLREFRSWQDECNQAWTLISPSKKKNQLGLEALKLPTPKSSFK